MEGSGGEKVVRGEGMEESRVGSKSWYVTTLGGRRQHPMGEMTDPMSRVPHKV